MDSREPADDMTVIVVGMWEICDRNTYRRGWIRYSMRIVKSCVLRGASYIKTRIWYSIHMMEKAGRETEKLIEELIVQFHMIEHGDVVIAGVSGGADSVCLLLTLCSLRESSVSR